MARSKVAVKILDRLTGEDGSLREMIAEDRLNFQVAQMIHDKRVAAGLTQAELAKLLGTTQSVVARLEAADYEGHSLSMLHRIALALHGRLEVKIVGVRGQRMGRVAHRKKIVRRKVGAKR
jgi:transcriptional regulator with XRE-family HTH domain